MLKANVKRLVTNPNATLSQVLMETDAKGNIIKHYVYGLGLISNEDATSYSLYHYDQRGNTIALTDQSGKVTDRMAYDPYGTILGRTGTTSTPFLFDGRDGVYSDSNGLLYMRARYYNSEMKRFISEDQVVGDIVISKTLNRFAYANENPVNYLDPNGNWAGIDDLVASVGGGISGIVFQGVTDAVSGHLSGWQDYTGSFVGGAVAGETLLYTANPIIAGAAGGLSSDVTSQGFKKISVTNYNWNVSNTISSTVFCGVLGAIRVPEGGIAGITSGRNSFSAVYKSGLTKLANGMSMSDKVILKGITSNGVKRIPEGAFGGFINGLYQEISNPDPENEVNLMIVLRSLGMIKFIIVLLFFIIIVGIFFFYLGGKNYKVIREGGKAKKMVRNRTTTVYNCSKDNM